MSTSQPVDRPATPVVGRHVLLDLYELFDTRLQDADALLELMVKHLDQNGFHQLGRNSHQFPGENAGATVMILLSESHATIHTYPEFNYAAVDVFCCGSADVDGFVRDLVDDLRPGRFEVVHQQRGGKS